MADDGKAPVRVTKDEYRQGMRRSFDGIVQAIPTSYYRGERPHFRHHEKHLSRSYFVKEYIAKDLLPEQPMLDKASGVVAFGSCFAYHIGHYLFERGYNVLTQKAKNAYVGSMGDGIVNTFAIRQQFEWAWNNWKPDVELWRGYDSQILGYDDEARAETQRIFEAADAFVITLGLSEIWYDEPTGEVFWRAVPTKSFDPERHKFRLSTVQENYENLKAIVGLIRKHRPSAKIIFTLSPIPLAATFRKLPSMVADSESKAILRVALGQLMREETDSHVYYMPSYEIVQRCFSNAYWSDRAHVHRHVVDFIMLVFERYFCDAGVTDGRIHQGFQEARALDAKVGLEGHDSVPGPKVAGGEAGAPAATLATSAARISDALIVGSGRTILEDNATITVRRSTEGAETVDAVVFPMGVPPDAAVLASLPAAVRAGIAEGRVRLVFDASTGGAPHDDSRSEALHAFALEAGARLSQCAYLTQDRGYEEAYFAFCDARGVSTRHRMGILNCDYWIRRFFALAGRDGEAELARRTSAFEARGKTRLRRFLSLNMTPRSTRNLLLTRLLADGLWDQGHISFGGFAGPQGLAQARVEMGELPGFKDLAETLDPQMDVLDAYGRVMLGDLAEPEGDGVRAEYDDSWFSIVTEPEMLGRTSRITEKVFKPLLNFHPTLIFGNPMALEALRQFGFKTFDGLIDETYDHELDPRRRFDAAYAQVRRLCELDERELARFEAEHAEAMAHNAWVGLVALPKRYRLKLDERLVNNIGHVSRGGARR